MGIQAQAMPTYCSKRKTIFKNIQGQRQGKDTPTHTFDLNQKKSKKTHRKDHICPYLTTT
jgi:hypothetical protein